jgi:SAM-dependent methyltransferase
MNSVATLPPSEAAIESIQHPLHGGSLRAEKANTMNLNCPILGRETEFDRTDYGNDLWSIVRCRETGFVFLENPPDYARLETEFAWERTSREERNRREASAPVMATVSTFAKRAKAFLFPSRNKIASIAFCLLRARTQSQVSWTVLDVGCAQGVLLVDLYNRCAQAGIGMVPLGIEVSRELALEAREKTASIGGRIAFANALDGVGEFEAGSIHLAMMCSFLEHECRPLPFLKRLHHVLTRDGEVVLKVPNFSSWNRKVRGKKWSGFRFPDHVNYFTPQTLKRLAHEAGFRVCRQSILDRFPFSDNMYAVLRKRC